MGDQNLMDKSMRSVFVGNIPYEATEEKLKEIFNEVGPVLSFKLVYDRETGKPKGYGFCEYKDQETALSAMRNLNGYEIGGRTLRVDNACTEKSRLEMQSLLQGPPVDNTYGEAVPAEKAPEAISKAVASLPPEQMFELMKQMKLCVQNNPAEARTMLLQNPQLAYALLQAQVVMRIVDPHVAVTMMHKASPMVQPVMPGPAMMPQRPVEPIFTPVGDWTPPQSQPPLPRPNPPLPPPISQPQPFGDMDVRAIDPRMSRIGDQDLRVSAGPPPLPPTLMNSHREPFLPNDQLLMENSVESFRDPRGGGNQFQRDPRAVLPPAPVPMPVAAPHLPGAPPPPPLPVAPPPPPRAGVGINTNIGSAASDQEKAALIMQVLQLSDEQIAMLPPEQRQSILVLKEQIAKSSQR